MLPATSGVVLVVFAVNQLTHLLRGAGQTDGRGCELALVPIVDGHRLTHHLDRLGARRPSEVGII